VRHRGLIGATLAGLAVVAGGIVVADDATAAQDRETREVVTATLPNDGGAYPVLRLTDLRLEAGQPRLLHGQYLAKKKVTGPLPDKPRFDNLQAAWITCAIGEPTQNAAYPDARSAMSTRNHEGRHGVDRGISVRWLFTPAASGTYTCVLWGRGAATIQQPIRHMSVLPGRNTVLRMVGAPQSGAEEWYQKSDVRVSNKDRSAVLLQHRWTAAPGARSVDAFHGTELSSTDGGPDPFVADTTLRVTQLTAANEPCAAATTATTRSTITTYIHHFKVNQVLPDIPIRTGDGCTRTFEFAVEVTYVLTMPQTPNRGGMAHGRVSAPLRPYSTAIAMNNF
jgi:hypothetical protein